MNVPFIPWPKETLAQGMALGHLFSNTLLHQACEEL
jgi:hypothetical protein